MKSVVALDAMGGDFAPREAVHGALMAARQGIPVALFGSKSIIEKVLSSCEGDWQKLPLSVFDALEQIGMAEEPVSAVQKKRNSSLVKAIMSVKRGACSSIVSAGNSGAIMAAATLFLGREQDVLRPAIAGFLPSLKGPILALDLGANVDCRAEHLAQFAQMGSHYAETRLTKKNPRIGLLANGHENEKGSRLTKEAFSLIKEVNLNFFGNVEPYHILEGSVDVVVCDGFSGNILLKSIEASHKFFVEKVKTYQKNSCESGGAILSCIGQENDSQHQGGALLLGIKGRVIVCHGGSNAAAIVHAIKLASTT